MYKSKNFVKNNYGGIYMKNHFSLTNRNNYDSSWFPWFTDVFDWSFGNSAKTTHGYLKTDIKEFDKSYVLFVEVPGYKKEDIDISYDDGYLTVSVSAENGYNDKNEYLRKERYFENYSRTFYVGNIDENDINASLDSGILNICIPKKTETKQGKKAISIN